MAWYFAYVEVLVTFKLTTMNPYNEAVGILNSLVFINDDRIKIYQKALRTINGNSSYESVFKRMIQQSINNREALNSMRESIGDDTGSESIVSAKIYSVWTDLRSNYMGDPVSFPKNSTFLK
mgnify:CR=1 FL=1